MIDTAQEFCLSVDSDESAAAIPAASHACLAQIFPLQFSKSLIQLNPLHPMLVGRDSNCHIELPDELVSREHAVIEFDIASGHWRLRDCDSRNGSFVNERQIICRSLAPGDQIRIGGHIFKFLSADHVEALYHESVYQMMTVDALTQIHNRRYFEDGIERELQRAQRHGRPLSVLLFDLDRFKLVNDTFGHLIGDEVLQALCQRVGRRVRRDELFARYGGEEFAIVLAESTVVQASTVAEDIRRIVATESFQTSRGEVPVTISIGVANTDGIKPMTTASLLMSADENLYKAKRAGRNCVC